MAERHSEKSQKMGPTPKEGYTDDYGCHFTGKTAMSASCRDNPAGDGGVDVTTSISATTTSHYSDCPLPSIGLAK